MALAVLWTKRADKKLEKIVDYLQEEWNDNVARAFVKRVYDFVDILIKFPEIGKIEHEERKIRGFVLVKQVTLFYKVTKDGIVILNLFDTRLKPSKKRY